MSHWARRSRPAASDTFRRRVRSRGAPGPHARVSGRHGPLGLPPPGPPLHWLWTHSRLRTRWVAEPECRRSLETPAHPYGAQQGCAVRPDQGGCLQGPGPGPTAASRGAGSETGPLTGRSVRIPSRSCWLSGLSGPSEGGDNTELSLFLFFAQQ